MGIGKLVLLVFAAAAIAAGCAASGKAVVDQYKDVTATRFEGVVAVVLEERETCKVAETGRSIITEGFSRIKLMNRKALDCGEDAPNCRLEDAVCYEAPYEEVELIEARTITPAGDVIEVKEDDIQDRTWTSWAVPEESFRCFVFQFKGASPGAILEKKYRTRAEKIHGLGSFHFQQRDPVLEASYAIDSPADYNYRWKAYRIDIQPTEQKIENRIIRSWTARDVPPLVLEENSVPPDDLRATLYFANEQIYSYEDVSDITRIKTWEDVGKWWVGVLKDQQKVTPEVKAIADDINKNEGTDTQKLKMLWEWMNKNIRYVARSSDKYDRGHRPLAAHVVCTKKYGDCKAVGNFIGVVGRLMGLKADPIIIGTRPALGKLQAVELELPGPWYFNHSIARVEADGKVYWMDANHRHLALGITPARNQGVHVVVANPDKPFLDFIPVQDAETNQLNTKVVYIPGADGEVAMESESSATGNIAETFRRRTYDNTPDKFQNWIEWYLGQSYKQISEVEQSYTGREDNNADFGMKVKAKIPRALQPAGKGVSFEVKEIFRSGAYDDFKPPKRRHALDLYYKWLRTHRFEVKIPAGMDPSGLPKNLSFEDDFLTVERLAQIENDRVVAVLTVKQKELIIPSEKYLEARKSYQKAMDAGSFVLLFEPTKKIGK